MSFEIKKASRKGIIPLIGMFGKSGWGKTFSALLLARGLAGPKGVIRLVDTEKGRGEIFADEIPGGYEVVRLDEPYTPDRYEDAIATAAQGASVLIVDSMSHSWEGEDGVLEKAENSREASKPGLHNWLHKPAHSRMLRKVCSLPIPVIACLRGKEVYRQIKEGGRQVIVCDPHTSPIQDKNFIYEMLVAIEVRKNENGDPGYPRIEKFTSARLLPVLPKPDERISIEHGKAISDWCNGVGGVDPELVAARKKLWDALESVRGTEKNWKVAQQWLWDEAGLDPSKSVQDMNISELSSITDKAVEKIKNLKGVAQ